jgi:hypothetical protein
VLNPVESLPWSRPPRTGHSAAEQCFGPHLAEIESEMGAAWARASKPHWRAKHAEAEELRRALERLEAKAERGPLDGEEQWALIDWRLRIGRKEEARTMLAEFARAYPGHAPAQFEEGNARLIEGDDSGIALLDVAMDLDWHSTQAACICAAAYLAEAGRDGEAERYRERGRKHEALLRAARHERSRVSADDTFVPHDLPLSERDLLRSQLSKLRDLESAYLVSKRVRSFPDWPARLLVLVPRPRWFELSRSDPARRLVRSVRGVRMPEYTTWVVASPKDRLVERVAGMPASDVV